MNGETDFIVRTEDIQLDKILDLFVPTSRDIQLIELLKSKSPLIIEGSRGTGKSFLLRVCEQQLLADFSTTRVLPIYVSFMQSSLLDTSNPQQFQHWMLAKLCSRILRALYQIGLLVRPSAASRLLAGDALETIGKRSKLDEIAAQYEESYNNPGVQIDDIAVPEVESFRDAIQDLCEELDIQRFNILFDEAAHIFRPEQQRQFFTLFRDLRSPYMTCNAAVYPGVTSYGASFETTHDARVESLHRDIFEPGYRDHMREIVFKQATSELQSDIERNGENFDALSYAVSGNPRLLLKIVARAGRLRASDVQNVLKEFFRTEIWSEHSNLTEKYGGHKALIDWGRNFLEQTVISDAVQKNESWRQEGKSERTCFFWVHRDAPEAVNGALRLLMYVGIVHKLDSGIVATRRETGTRYSINIGCLASSAANPIAYISDVRRGLTIKRFTEYGANYSAFTELAASIGEVKEYRFSEVVAKLFAKHVSVLDLSTHQKSALLSISIDTVGKAFTSSEESFRQASYIGPVRSRKIKNVVTAAVLEYLSG